MMPMHFEDEDIIYNNDTKEYELFIKGEQRARGTFEGCMDALRIYYNEELDPQTISEDAMRSICDNFIAHKTVKQGTDAGIVHFPAANVRDNIDAIELVASFACDILADLQDAKKLLYGKDEDGRRDLKCAYFDAMQDLVSMYADKIAEVNL